VLVKAALYAATLGAAGGVFFLKYSRPFLDDGARLAIARPLRMLIALAIAASAARVLITAGSLGENAAAMLDPRLLAMVWHGGEGRAAAIRAGGLLLSIPALAQAGRAGWPAVAGAALAATSFAWVGHMHSAAPPAAPVLLAAHVLAAAFWLGALPPLVILSYRHEPRELGAVARHFGRIAVAVLGALLAAGAALLYICLASVSDLWNSPYGRIACAKIALVACLLALAAWNKLRLVPQIRAGDPLAVQRFRRSVRAEMLVAGLILLITAVLTTLVGPPSMS
jgi:putative copper export protein